MSLSYAESNGLRLLPRKEDYYHESENLRDQLRLPIEAVHCQILILQIKTSGGTENFHVKLTSFLLAAAFSAIKTTGRNRAGNFNIPGWNSVVKSRHQIAKAAFWALAMGKLQQTQDWWHIQEHG